MELLEKILVASIELFRQYGFKTITMDDIARKSGVSKKTLYQQFANKNEVVNESMTWYQGKISENCTSMMNNSENAVEGMVKVMEMFDQIYRQLNPTALLELERFYPEGFKKFRENILSKDVIAIRENIQKGISEGLYRADIDAEFLSRFRVELFMIMFHTNLLVNDRFDLKTVAYKISEHFLYGIMTEKGVKLYKKYKEKYLTDIVKI
jgi:AcrR family transcriptional regulator